MRAHIPGRYAALALLLGGLACAGNKAGNDDGTVVAQDSTQANDTSAYKGQERDTSAMPAPADTTSYVPQAPADTSAATPDTSTYAPTAPADTTGYAPTAPADTTGYAPAPTDTTGAAPPADTTSYAPQAPTDTGAAAPVDTSSYAPAAPSAPTDTSGQSATPDTSTGWSADTTGGMSHDSAQ